MFLLLNIPAWNIIPIVNFLNKAVLFLKSIFLEVLNDRRNHLINNNNNNNEIDDCLSVMLKENMTEKEMCGNNNYNY